MRSIFFFQIKRAICIPASSSLLRSADHKNTGAITFHRSVVTLYTNLRRVLNWIKAEREMASVMRGVLKAIKEKGIVNFAKHLKEEGYLNCIFDGNLLQTKIHNIGATVVGVDKFGNKYYERLDDTQYGRHRWVEYAQKSRYNASQVPPEWHGWLHFITDHTGDELLMLKPKRYGVEHKENFSGEGDEYIYHSKGHALNPGQRDWTRYQPWLPTKTAS